MAWKTLLGAALVVVGVYSLYGSVSDWLHGVNLGSAPVGTVVGTLMVGAGLILLDLL